jgi:hypothetical protein
MSLTLWATAADVYFAKFVTDLIFLQIRDKINIKKSIKSRRALASFSTEYSKLLVRAS